MKDYQRPWLEVDHERAWKLILGGAGLLLLSLVLSMAFSYSKLERALEGCRWTTGLPLLCRYWILGLAVDLPGFFLSGIWILSRGPREGRPGWILLAACGFLLGALASGVDGLRYTPAFHGWRPGARAFVELVWVLSFAFTWIAWWAYDVVRRERDQSRARTRESRILSR